MLFKLGDLVVRKWSKAATIKRKVFRVIAELPPITSYHQKYRLITPSGRQVDMYEHQISLLENEITRAQTKVDIARRVLADAENAVVLIRNEVIEARKLFPII